MSFPNRAAAIGPILSDPLPPRRQSEPVTFREDYDWAASYIEKRKAEIEAQPAVQRVREGFPATEEAIALEAEARALGGVSYGISIHAPTAPRADDDDQKRAFIDQTTDEQLSRRLWSIRQLEAQREFAQARIHRLELPFLSARVREEYFRHD